MGPERMAKGAVVFTVRNNGWASQSIGATDSIAEKVAAKVSEKVAAKVSAPK